AGKYKHEQEGEACEAHRSHTPRPYREACYKSMNFALTIALRFYALAVNFDPVHARRRRGAAARHQVGPADLGNLRQVRPVDPGAFNHLGDIQTPPADVGDIEFAHTPVLRRAVGLIGDEPGSIGELQDKAQLAEPGLLCAPADLGEAGEIDGPRLVAQAQRTIGRARACPDIVWIVGRLVVVTLPDTGLARPMQRQHQLRV